MILDVMLYSLQSCKDFDQFLEGTSEGKFRFQRSQVLALSGMCEDSYDRALAKLQPYIKSKEHVNKFEWLYQIDLKKLVTVMHEADLELNSLKLAPTVKTKFKNRVVTWEDLLEAYNLITEENIEVKKEEPKAITVKKEALKVIYTTPEEVKLVKLWKTINRIDVKPEEYDVAMRAYISLKNNIKEKQYVDN